MKGIELARSFYEAYGIPMLEQQFGDERCRIAAGLCGHGSECFGFDDEISRDHDFEPGFCLWIPQEDEPVYGFRLFRAYGRLPGEFMGVRMIEKSLLGSRHKGVHTVESFYSFYMGDRVPETCAEWMAVPDHYLAEATNGCVFEDPLGRFTRIRQRLLDRPEDVRLKKLGSCLFHMAQTGQYNYARCLRHGEEGAAALALSGFCENTAKAVFLLNRAYAPYYKWLFRGMRDQPLLGGLAADLTQLMGAPLQEERNVPLIESVCARVAEALRQQGLTACRDAYLEPYAYSVGENIRDSGLRNSPVML
ncbi:MAG: DUF4037 domain-containing protein [Clostridia bacterium]|nr:DUF4037 domain-containing protein [Clostridia bacterium]